MQSKQHLKHQNIWYKRYNYQPHSLQSRHFNLVLKTKLSCHQRWGRHKITLVLMNLVPASPSLDATSGARQAWGLKMISTWKGKYLITVSQPHTHDRRHQCHTSTYAAEHWVITSPACSPAAASPAPASPVFLFFFGLNIISLGLTTLLADWQCVSWFLIHL